MSAIIETHLSNTFRGMLAAITADLALIMVYGCSSRIIGGLETGNWDSTGFLWRMIILPIVTGMPAGIIYGFYKKRSGTTKSSILGFWLLFWGLTFFLLASGEALFFTPGPINHIIAAALSLFIFTGIWTYLMEVLYEHPFAYPPLTEDDQEQGKSIPAEYCNSRALIKRRKN